MMKSLKSGLKNFFKLNDLSYITIAILSILSIGILLLVYSPHFSYPYPFHIDEWHHISQSKRILGGEYMKTHIASGFGVIEMGFHYLLWPLNKVTNLVLIYKFLPALWAVLGALTLFFITRNKTGSFITGLFAMVFFASLKSNVNLLGLWFFTPFTFSIPFVYLYTYLITEGIRLKNKNYITTGLVIMIGLIPFYATAVLFIMPALLIYAYLHREYILQEASFFKYFLLVPLAGLAFYKLAIDLPWLEVYGHLKQTLQFNYGWGVLEIRNTWTEVYSPIGYILAFAGSLFILIKKQTRRYAFYLLWPVALFFSIEIFREVGISFFAPYQRNFYYLALSLPILSAIGLYHFLYYISQFIENQKWITQQKNMIIIVTLSLSLALVSVLTFKNYYDLPPQLSLYGAIDGNDYKTLTYLKTLEKGRVLAPAITSTALYAISGQTPAIDIFFVGNREIAQVFYDPKTECIAREEIISTLKVDYVMSKEALNCQWPLIYNKTGYVYEVKNLSK